MPLQNRVAPDGSIHAVAARGTMMGNRGGRLHDPASRQLSRARWRSRAWICCATAFRGRWRPVMGAGYTELFFLDEVTALAAGHRPCFECRRQDALRFRAAWTRAGNLQAPPSAPEMDAVLHAERTRARQTLRLSSLPDAAVARLPDGRFAARRGNQLLRWDFAGYTCLAGVSGAAVAELMTPPAILAVLAAGYRPRWHDSAAVAAP
jgi:hypothetical protein